MRFLFLMFLFVFNLNAQTSFDKKFQSLMQIKLDSGVTVTFDEPVKIYVKKPFKVIIYALPNGNTTAQTFGKNLSKDDDWHYDIQHIYAQTQFIRQTDSATNYIVAYLENNLKSWPAWRKKNSNNSVQINEIVEKIRTKYKEQHPKITLSGHSGGGSFIFGYLNGNDKIPDYMERIGFLDATYGYETELHAKKISHWLKNKKHHLEVIAYNDSVVVYNGKPLVSPTGGTWYRSKLMATDLEKVVSLNRNENTERIFWKGKNEEFILIKNPEAKIYHTKLVDKNGFIHVIFSGSRFEEKNYKFWSERAFQNFILD